MLAILVEEKGKRGRSVTVHSQHFAAYNFTEVKLIRVYPQRGCEEIQRRGRYYQNNAETSILISTSFARCFVSVR